MQFDDNGWLDLAIEIDYLNKSQSRAGLRPTHIVLHGTAGGTSAQNIANYFATGSELASAHFIIGQDGTIVQGVPCSLAAWGNGIIDLPRISLPPGIDPNFYTISIEHCKPLIDNSDQLTTPQKQSSFRLVQAICDHYNIPKRRGDMFGGIIEHADIDSVSRARCPGPYPWTELLTFLGGQPMTPSKNQITAALQEWNSTASSFPSSVSPSYTTGIAAAWRDHYYRGQQLGGPTSGEETTGHDGKNRIDWNNNPVVFQYFRCGHAEWSNGACRFFDGRGEIV